MQHKLTRPTLIAYMADVLGYDPTQLHTRTNRDLLRSLSIRERHEAHDYAAVGVY